MSENLSFPDPPMGRHSEPTDGDYYPFLEGFEPGTPEYEQARQEWLERNEQR